jgi:hypothetical protein
VGRLISVKLKDVDPNQVMDIVRELRQQGLVQSKDFDFAYYQSRWDEMIGEIPTSAVFSFYTEKYATMFAIKYSA